MVSCIELSQTFLSIALYPSSKTLTLVKMVWKKDPTGNVQPKTELETLIAQDTVPWHKKRNLRNLYLCLVPAVLGVEMTSGYDGSVLNGLQAVERWNICSYYKTESTASKLTNPVDYNHPDGAILGIISAMMNIGSVAGIPFVPYCNDRWGRKFVIVLGSFIAAAGIILQTAAINRMSASQFR
jgi:hypothetical protein